MTLSQIEVIEWLVTLGHVPVGARLLSLAPAAMFSELSSYFCGHFLAGILFSKGDLLDEFPEASFTRPS